MPQPKSISPGKGGKPYGKKSQIFRLKYDAAYPYTFTSKITNKIFKFTLCLLAKIPVNYANSTQFAHKLRELREIRTIHLPIIPYVSDPCHSKELSEISVNQADFAQFAHRCCELREIHTNY